MVANLFRKTNLTTGLLSAILLFGVLFFFHSDQLQFASLSLRILSVLGKTALLMSLLGILLLIKRKDRYFILPPFIFLLTPIVLFLVPQQSVQTEGLVVSVLLALAFQEFVLMEQQSQILKPLFNSSLFFSLIALLEPQLTPLFLITVGALIIKKQVNLKGVTAVLTPVLSFVILFATLRFFWDLENPFGESFPLEHTEFSSAEGLIFSSFSVFVAGLFFLSKASQSKLSSSLKNLFHLVILAVGLMIALNPKGSGLNFYEIIFFSIIYFSALAFDTLSDLKANLLLLFFIILKIVATVYLIRV